MSQWRAAPRCVATATSPAQRSRPAFIPPTRRSAQVVVYRVLGNGSLRVAQAFVDNSVWSPRRGVSAALESMRARG